MGWEPIATAPKDGTTVLVWGLALEFEEPSWYKASFKGDYWDDPKPYWHWGAPGYVGCVAATHWMPLPDPPVATPIPAPARPRGDSGGEV